MHPQEEPRQMFSRQPAPPDYDVTPSNPRKPHKPVYLSTYAKVKALLAQKPDFVINPAYLETAWLPEKVNEVLHGQTQYSLKPKEDKTPDNRKMTMAYFTELMREIVQREVIIVDKDKPIYQVDVTRESVFASECSLVADINVE